MSNARPKVALIITSYFRGSHADVIGTRLIEGYEWNGTSTPARVEVVSMYLEQIGSDGRPDIGIEITDRHSIPRFPTVAEAISCGRSGVNVDGVVIIGEHGDYELNEYGQKLYPRRRLFDSAVSTMVGAGRTVPIFNDKHLSWSFVDARAMFDTARRFNIPLLAGSTIPLAWRIPTATEWPQGAPMTEAVLVGFGPTEIYGFHNLEGLQVHAERRSDGESGVVKVQALSGSAAVQAISDGSVNPDLLAAALATFDLNEAEQEEAKNSAKDVFLVEYADGLRAAVINCDKVIRNFGIACRGPSHEMSCQMWLQPEPYDHFLFLCRQIEAMILDGVAPYPVERTLLTTGVLDAAMRSRHDLGAPRQTPELNICYQPNTALIDTGVRLPLPTETSEAM